jgi:NADPH2:quinone reductase
MFFQCKLVFVNYTCLLVLLYHSLTMAAPVSSFDIIPTTMKAVVVRAVGGLEALSYETDYPVPTLKEGQVLVKNDLAGLNFIDTYYRTGLYKQALPFVSGQEGGGTVVAIGSNEQDTHSATSSAGAVQIGDKVVYMAMGSYCEYTAVAADRVVPVPERISLETAVACMVQGLTAHYLVTDACCHLIKPHADEDWCLIYSVGSGTCQWAAQMAKLQGYKVIGTTSKTKVNVVPKGCCDELIVLETAEGKTYADYESVDLVQRVMEVTGGKGAKCIIDGVGMSTSEISIQCLARRGIWISFGNASGAVPDFSLLRLTPKSAFCTRPKLGDYVATKEELEFRSKQVFDWVAEKKLDVKVDKIFSLENVKDGHAYLEAGQSKGKVLFKV